MPEGDTVHLAATRLHAALAGQTLTRTDFRVPQLAVADFAGREVRNVIARGKHLLLRIAPDVTLHTHFKMEGSWHLYRHGERWHGPGWQARVVLETAGWVAVGFRLAIVELFPTARERERLAHLGPDPLGDDWDDGEALRRLVADPARTISEALLDQRVMAGIGNVWRCELCFLRGVDPWTPVGAVREPEKLVSLTKRLFEANRGTGSHVTTGDGRPGNTQWVYGRRNQPCRRCGTRIQWRQAADPGRVTYWCPRCQPPSP